MIRALRALLVVAVTAANPAAGEDAPAPPKFRAGRIEAPAVAECSGLVASRRHAGVFWAICDSGNPAELHALTRQGKLLATFPVGVPNVDWEDVATDDDGHLYLAETGNNEHRRRPAVVYQIHEPDPAKPPAAAGANGRPRPLAVTKTWRRDFPDGPADCEALFVHGGRAYLIPKRLDGRPAALCAFDLSGGPGPEKLEAVATLPLRSPVTAADLSPDGRWLAVLSVTGPSLFRVDGDLSRVAAAKPAGVFYVSPAMEAAALVDDGLLVATEDRDVFLFRWKDFGLADAEPAAPAKGKPE